MRSCFRPGCARPAGGAVGMDRDNLVVIIARPTNAAPGMVVLCDMHLQRVAVPNGWRLDDQRRAVPIDAPAAPAATAAAPAESPPAPTAAPATASSLPAALTTAQPTGLLGRAFRSAQAKSAPAEARGLAWLERAHQEVDSSPQHATRGVNERGHDDGDGDADGEDRADGDVGDREHEPHHEGDQQRAEGQDRVDPDRADEVTFDALELEAAARAALRELEPAPEYAALAADDAAPGERPAKKRRPARGARAIIHVRERTDELSLFPDLFSLPA